MKRRELAGWIGLATLGVAMIALCAVVGWPLVPRERRLPLGTPAPENTPAPRIVDGVGGYYSC